MTLSLLFAVAGCVLAGEALAVDEPIEIVSNAFGRIEYTLRGAQIRSWRTADGVERLFRPRDMTFRGIADNRGGIPVCWPWFGMNGEKGAKPHGFARYTMFRQVRAEETKDGSARTLVLSPSPELHRIWPYDCELEYTMTLGRDLRLKLVTRNCGTNDAWITEGLHPYWKVGDRRKVTVTGLEGLPYCFADLGREATAKWRGTFVPAVHYDHVFWRGDRAVTIADSEWGREIRISGSGYNKYVIWTPAEFKAGDFENLMPEDMYGFVCVEPATLFRPDGYSLRPGESHTMEVVFSAR